MFNACIYGFIPCKVDDIGFNQQLVEVSGPWIILAALFYVYTGKNPTPEIKALIA